MIFIRDQLDGFVYNDSTGFDYSRTEMTSVERYFFRNNELFHAESEGEDPFAGDKHERTRELLQAMEWWRKKLTRGEG